MQPQTTLALEYARRHAALYPAGVAFVLADAASELELLPRQITDLEEKLKTRRSLRTDLQRRGEQADLREALALGDKIDEQQREVRHPMRFGFPSAVYRL